MGVKTNTGLVDYCRAQLGNPYWYGTFGQTATITLLTQKSKQYTSQYTNVRIARAKAQHLGKRVHDCIGLVKGYLWSTSTTAKPKYNSAQDLSANTMVKRCTEKGDINTIPEIPGVLVFFPGHVGVYIGNGKVIEARGFNYGVVETKLSERPWKTWGKCPFIDYATKPAPAPTTAKPKPTTTVKKEEKTVNVALAVLSKGSKGNSVKVLQILLKSLGYKGSDGKVLNLDGDFGANTEYAVMKYQTAKGLTADGKVGAKTWTSLLK